MFTRFVTTTCFALIVLSGTEAVAEFNIDDYSVGSVIAQFGSGTAVQTTVHGGILGGSRDTTLTVPNLGGTEFFGVVGFGAALNVAQGSEDQISGSFLYDDFGTIDLTVDANYGFGLQVIGSDSLTPITDAFSIRITSGATSSIVSFDAPASGAVPTLVTVDFGSFSGVDLTNVDSIELLFDLSGSPGTDLAIGGFIVVPEPSSTILGVLVVALLGLRRRSLRANLVA